MRRTTFCLIALILAVTMAACNSDPLHLYDSKAPVVDDGGGHQAPDVPSPAPSEKPVDATPSPEPTPTPTPLPEGFDDQGIFCAFYGEAYAKLQTLTTEQKIGQLLLARCPDEGAAAAIREYNLGGLVLFGSDFKGKTREQVVGDIQSYQDAAAIPLIISTDEEGGTVVRVSSNKNLAKSKFASPASIYLDGGLDAIRTDAITKAGVLKDLGINVNLAPVSDVSTDKTDYIYKRTLGEPADVTARYVEAVVRATQAEHVSCVLKHFPGYGSNVDTHTDVAHDKRKLSEFEESDFLPFIAGIDAGADCVLVSHNIVEAMDKKNPASLSVEVHNLLRSELGFTGIIMTDDLAMDAIKKYAKGSHAAVLAVKAGNDMLILTDYDKGFDAIKKALDDGELDMRLVDHAAFRVLAWKYYKGLIE